MRSQSEINLKDIVKILKQEELFLDEFITDDKIQYQKIEFNSKNIYENDIFACIIGLKSDGHDFAKNAIESGAKLLIVERFLPFKVNQIKVKDSRKACATVSLLINDFPTSEMKLIGITGTNGKTTTGYLIFNSLKNLDEPVGFIGTLGYWINEDFHSLSRTTPDIIELHKIFFEMKKKNVRIVVMEVSSHSISLSRIYGLRFSIAMITNLSHEHLDFHKNMDDYADTKFQFLINTLEMGGKVVVNYDNEYIRQRFIKGMLKLSFQRGDFLIKNINYGLNKSAFDLKYFDELYKIETNLVGKYNIQNSAMAFIALKLLKLKINESLMLNALKKIKSIPGRLQQFKDTNVFVDFAHTPDALENVLSTLRNLTKKRLIVVIGAGGDRDKSKRPLMTEVCLKYSNLTILTSDNPRSEKPDDIIRDMFSSVSNEEDIFIQTDRENAIKTALTILNDEDILLIAGKGHENYQEINGIKYHFNDLETVERYFKKGFRVPQNEEGCTTIKLQIPIDSLYLEFLFMTKINKTGNFKNISIDNRTITSDSIFFAIKGEKFDAHKFVDNLESTCISIIDDENYSTENTVLVDNVVMKFQLLSSKYAKLFVSQKIAITGSYGKTTTKEYLSRILSSQGKILKTYLNENNHIGVPKTLFRTNSSHKYSIIELGTNHPGEIEILSKIALAEIGIITAIGVSHIEYFGTIENILKEKISMLNFVKSGIVSGDNDLLFEAKGNSVSVGKLERNDFSYKIISQDENSTKVQIDEIFFTIPTIINSKIEDAMLAIVCGLKEDISYESIQLQLKNDLTIPQRMEIRKSNQRIIIVDCYNANYDSMVSAIDFWKNYKTDLPHFAFLGDMLELGEESINYHKKIGDLFSRTNFELVSVGNFSKYFYSKKHFSDVDELLIKMNFGSIPKNAVILIKASHGIHLEKLIKRL